ncbi:hypothetical protein [Candidatus Berkiella aquae]|uniref:Uncharacterized protein n=1 Tax=Candidatus Berkiella aquae TaxID=295108 RepID=A0A0Q9YUI6_9GAMM|nr:hypothetical protein [Candidatus Berkiella aquae]MCS5711202.1 hypothetical protein [Candidatus Berkiella aquae]
MLALFSSPHLSRSFISDNKHGSAPTYQYNDKEWYKTNSNINWANHPNQQWISLGSSHKREHLLFDEDSIIIQNIKSFAIFKCRPHTHDIPTILATVNDILNQLTQQPGKTDKDVESQLNEQVNQLICKKKLETSDSESPVISIDELITRKLLVCRHKAPLAASILGELVRQNILPPGIVRQYRTSLFDDTGKVTGAHAWATFRDQATNELWMCDPRWKYVQNVSKNASEVMKRKYGELATTMMLHRLDALDDAEFQSQSSESSSSESCSVSAVEPHIEFLDDNVQDQYQRLKRDSSLATRFLKATGKKISAKYERRLNELTRIQDLFEKMRHNWEMQSSEKANLLYAYLHNVERMIAAEQNTYHSNLTTLCGLYKYQLYRLFKDTPEQLDSFKDIKRPDSPRCVELIQRANQLIHDEQALPMRLIHG